MFDTLGDINTSGSSEISRRTLSTPSMTNFIAWFGILFAWWCNRKLLFNCANHRHAIAISLGRFRLIHCVSSTSICHISYSLTNRCSDGLWHKNVSDRVEGFCAKSAMSLSLYQCNQSTFSSATYSSVLYASMSVRIELSICCLSVDSAIIEIDKWVKWPSHRR